MVESKVSVRRYVKAMIAATDRSECLGLVLLAGAPEDVGTADDGPALSAIVGPYLGLARPVVAGDEAAGVVLPDGTRVLADGLDAHCWPGSEPAFREELGTPSPESWSRGPRTDGSDVAADAAAAIAWYVGIEARSMPVAAVLDPATRRAVVLSLPRGLSVRAFLERLLGELDGWPRRRLAVVEALVTARVDRVELEHPYHRGVARIRDLFTDAQGHSDDHARAVRLARCVDALRSFETTALPPRRTAPSGARDVEADSDQQRRSALLDALITERRGELDRCDRAASSADAAARAARAEAGDLRSTVIRPPEALVGWRVEHLRARSALRRRLRAFS